MPRNEKGFSDTEVLKLFKRLKTGKMIDNDGLMLIEYLEQLDSENCHNLKTCDPVENEFYKGCAMIVDKMLDNFANCTKRQKKSSGNEQLAHN
jgi:hypothetical protein